MEQVDAAYRKALAAQRRSMQIQLIRQFHPVYDNFNFSHYNDFKIAEMYRLLVRGQQEGKDKEVQTNV
jgi:hypothetical protein